MFRLSLVRNVLGAVRPAARLTRGLAVTPDAVFRKGSPVPAKKQQAPEARDLGSVLERELAYEREDSAATLDSLKAIAADITDFKLVDTVGHARFFLTRTLGSQEIRVDVDCTPVQTDDMPEEEDEEGKEEGEEGAEEEEDHGHMEGNRILINIKDAAKGKTLQVGGTVTDMLQVHRVTLYDSGKEPSPDAVFGGADDIPLYVGPAFEELDDAVQNGFYEYLEERGVHDELAAKLSDYANTKEQTEYVRWLQNIRNFVK